MQKITRPAALVVALLVSFVLTFSSAYADGRQRRNNPRRRAVTRSAQPVGFDEAHVSRAIQSRISVIRSCYERQLRANPDLAGKVTIEFTVEQSGDVVNARATENTTRDERVASCIVGTVSRLRFDPAPTDASVTLNYPFVFAP